MRSKLIATGVSAATLLLTTLAAQATTLPVQNPMFTDYTGVAPKGSFGDVKPVDWIGGPGLFDGLIAVDAPGTASATGHNPGYYYGVFSGFPNPPTGGNFIQADGNTSFATSFNQVITGLTPGQTYTLSFWQAAGQRGYRGPTTEQWKVFFGTGTFSVDCGVNPCTVSTSGDITEYDTPLMNTPAGGFHPWNEVHLNLLATAATETISFLAWGDNGNTTNLPPTVFLAGVNAPSKVPEPTALSLLGVGLLGLGTVGLRRRALRNV